MTLFPDEIRHPWIKLLLIIGIIFLLSQVHYPGHHPPYIDRMIGLQQAALAYADAHDGVFPNSIAELIGTKYLKDKRNYGPLFDSAKLSYLPPENAVASPLSQASKEIPLMTYKTGSLTAIITIGGKIQTKVNSRE
jgi:hypothetical protein